ncbi:class I SAM-dependent methyltransferase ['Crotalaria aegyptiaca' phytoplasma]|uniref:Class I SAM-dependent methyltransferase n=1 Tax=Candidatus Phytoplasma crotalariae TaxID=2982627 RepID=A0ABT9D349_9MOLU|nr:tRNA (adenine(22)-N(1))-methyltransferase TrmK ['Crotalaria aegyptiaca' phytoplasma]MDO8059010.1 class I SAM-dependent methyltransferase ['Crotalaria aegyptiaca' phytoplasma]
MNRILFIASLIKNYNTVADIGTDHGLVLKKALDLGYIRKGIAVDISAKALSRARKNLENYPVQFFVSDGFQNISVDFDLAVICGLGAYTIINILKNAPITKPCLLGCQSKIHLLFDWLKKNDFIILKHYVFSEGAKEA